MKYRIGLVAIIGTAAIVGGVAPAATAAHSAGPAPAPASVSAPAAEAHRTDVSGRWTKGTAVTFRNDTGATIWVRHYDCLRDWHDPRKMEPGTSLRFTGDHPGTDDVELRVFRTEKDAESNWLVNSYEIDAENPAYSSPWMSVGYDNHYFREGETHTWHAGSQPGRASFWGKRHDDTDKYKVFELHMKSLW